MRALSSGTIRGIKAHDGRFDELASGQDWLAFEEPQDVVFWNPVSGEIATWEGRSFALGEEAIGNPATFSFGRPLNVLATVARWILADGDGIFILRWEWAFDRLRDCPRIAVDREIITIFRQAMRLPHAPKVSIRGLSERKAT